MTLSKVTLPLLPKWLWPSWSIRVQEQSPRRLGTPSWYPQAPALTQCPRPQTPVLSWFFGLPSWLTCSWKGDWCSAPWYLGGLEALPVRGTRHTQTMKTKVRVQKIKREAGGAQLLGPENHSGQINLSLGFQTGLAEAGMGDAALPWSNRGKQAHSRWAGVG